MQPTIVQYLRQYPEKMPEWMKKYKPGDRVSFPEVMTGRIGYYPGCDSDGQLIKLGNMSQTVHTYLYVDYLLPLKDIHKRLSGPRSIVGYHVIGNRLFQKCDLTPDGPYPLSTSRTPMCRPDSFLKYRNFEWYCEMYIWERDTDRSSDWGAERLATIFLCDDGIDTYYQLFVKAYGKAPWIMLLQDHGYGCNYDCFGKGGIMEEIIVRDKVFPHFVLLGDNSRIWPGYRKTRCYPETGGLCHHLRYLYLHDITEPIPPMEWELPAEDPLLDELIEYVSVLSTEKRKSLHIPDIQRKYCIGYNRAVRLMYQLKKANRELLENYSLSFYGIHWPVLDKDLSFDGFFCKSHTK